MQVLENLKISKPIIPKTHYTLCCEMIVKFGTVRIYKNHPRMMGILNASNESFYKKSIQTSFTKIRDAAKDMEAQGADFIDIGGMSTAPHLGTMVPEKTEIQRVVKAIRIVKDACNLPISVDTLRSSVAKASLENGAQIINDVTGLQYDRIMSRIIEKYQPSLVLCAYSKKTISHEIQTLIKLLEKSLLIAKSVKKNNDIALDPAIGFFRQKVVNNLHSTIKIPWYKRDLDVIDKLDILVNKFNQPILISISNKSFIKKINNAHNYKKTLAGSLAAQVVASIKGVSIIRTHNILETKKILS